MAVEFHSVKDGLRLTLAESMDDEQTEVDVQAGQGAGCPAPPFFLRIGSEQVEVVDVTDDTLTVVRGVNSTAAVTHASAVKADLDVVAEQVAELHDALEEVYGFLSILCGDADGVLRDAEPPTALEVVAQDTPDMTVKVRGGSGIVLCRPVVLQAPVSTAALEAPETHPRIDVVQISAYREVSVVTGEEAAVPAAPSVDSGCMGLAEIYCRVGMTSVEDADDSVNGYITDTRTYR